MIILVPGWSTCFSCNLDASSSDDCLGRFKSRIKSIISAWSNKEAGNNQQLLLKLSTDMSSSAEVEEYLSVSSSSRSGRQLNTGLGASTTWGTGLKAKLKFGYWSRMFLFLIEDFHIDHSEVTICNMVYLLPLDHWNAKRKVLVFSMGPWSQRFHTACADLCGTHALCCSLSLILKSAK